MTIHHGKHEKSRQIEVPRASPTGENRQQPVLMSSSPRPFKMMRKSSMVIADTGELIRPLRRER